MGQGGVGVIVGAGGGGGDVEGAEDDEAGGDGDHHDQQQDRQDHSDDFGAEGDVHVGPVVLFGSGQVCRLDQDFLLAEEALPLGLLGHAAKAPSEFVGELVDEGVLLAHVDEGVLGLEVAEVHDGVEGLELFGDGLDFVFDFFEFGFVLLEVFAVLFGLLEDLLFFLHCLDGLVVAHELLEVPVVVVHDFHFVGSPVQSVEIGLQVVLQVGRVLAEAGDGHRVEGGVHDVVVALRLLDDGVQEEPPMDVEGEQGHHGEDVEDGDDEVGGPVGVGEVAEGELGQGQGE